MIQWELLRYFWAFYGKSLCERAIFVLWQRILVQFCYALYRVRQKKMVAGVTGWRSRILEVPALSQPFLSPPKTSGMATLDMGKWGSFRATNMGEEEKADVDQ